MQIAINGFRFAFNVVMWLCLTHWINTSFISHINHTIQFMQIAIDGFRFSFYIKTWSCLTAFYNTHLCTYSLHVLLFIHFYLSTRKQTQINYMGFQCRTKFRPMVLRIWTPICIYYSLLQNL